MGCCSVKISLFIIALLETLIYGAFLGVAIYFTINLDSELFDKLRDISKQNFIVAAINEFEYYDLMLMVRFIVLDVLRIIAGFSMMIGLIMSSHCLFNTWIVFKMMVFFLEMTSMVLLIPVYYAEVPLIFAEVPILAMSLFSWAFLHTHCRDLRKKARASRRAYLQNT